MENQEEILKKLASGDETLTREAIREIQENGDLELAEVLLCQALQCGNENQQPLVGLLADIKESSFREVLIRMLKVTTDPSQKALLIRIAWESSLDYSGYWELFADILAEDEFETALEASTALENLIYQLNPEQCSCLKARLEDPALPEEKKFLTESILREIEQAEQEEEKENEDEEEHDHHHCHH